MDTCPFLCDFCERTFVSERTLNIHVRFLHTQDQSDLKVQSFDCLKCGRTYSNEQLLKGHIQRIHQDKEDKTFEDVEK